MANTSNFSSTTESYTSTEPYNLTEGVITRCGEDNTGAIIGGVLGAVIFVLLVVNGIIWYLVIKKKMCIPQRDDSTIENSLLRERKSLVTSKNIYDDVRNTLSSPEIIEMDSGVTAGESDRNDFSEFTSIETDNPSTSRKRESGISRKDSKAPGFKKFIIKKIPPGQQKAVTALARVIPKKTDSEAKKKNKPENVNRATESEMYQTVDEISPFEEDLYSDTMVTD